MVFPVKTSRANPARVPWIPDKLCLRRGLRGGSQPARFRSPGGEAQAGGEVNQPELHAAARAARAVGGDAEVDAAAQAEEAAHGLDAAARGRAADGLEAEVTEDLGHELAVGVPADEDVEVEPAVVV